MKRDLSSRSAVDHPASQSMAGTVCPSSSCSCVPGPRGVPAFGEAGEKPVDISALASPDPSSQGLVWRSEMLPRPLPLSASDFSD